MNQEKLLFAFVTILAGGCPVLPYAVADSASPEKNPAFADRATITATQVQTNQVLAHDMMGHIGLAQIALDMGLENEASQQIEKALLLDNRLSDQVSRMAFKSTFEFTRVNRYGASYVAEHRIPIVDTVFLLGQYNTAVDYAGETELREFAGGAVRVGVSMAPREVCDALTQAANSLVDNNVSSASETLNRLSVSTVNVVEKLDGPELMIIENLALARSFLEHKRYDSARVTLKYVEEQIESRQNGDLSEIDEKSLQQFTLKLNAIRQRLRANDPTMRERFYDRISKWREVLSIDDSTAEASH